MAKVSSAENSNAALPRNSVRASNQAMSKPTPAQIGAAMADKVSVVNNDFQAVPANTQPNSPDCTSNAVLKCTSVNVKSRPQVWTKPPAKANR